VQINMDDADFARIANGLPWAADAVYWAESGRFEEPSPSWKWKHIYWMGSYTAVILGRSFLADRGHDFEVVYDWNDDPDDHVRKGWAILTDYETRAS
jgi:hypothetical protein